MDSTPSTQPSFLNHSNSNLLSTRPSSTMSTIPSTPSTMSTIFSSSLSTILPPLSSMSSIFSSTMSTIISTLSSIFPTPSSMSSILSTPSSMSSIPPPSSMSTIPPSSTMSTILSTPSSMSSIPPPSSMSSTFSTPSTMSTILSYVSSMSTIPPSSTISTIPQSSTISTILSSLSTMSTIPPSSSMSSIPPPSSMSSTFSTPSTMSTILSYVSSMSTIPPSSTMSTIPPSSTMSTILSSLSTMSTIPPSSTMSTILSSLSTMSTILSTPSSMSTIPPSSTMSTILSTPSSMSTIPPSSTMSTILSYLSSMTSIPPPPSMSTILSPLSSMSTILSSLSSMSSIPPPSTMSTILSPPSSMATIPSTILWSPSSTTNQTYCPTHDEALRVPLAFFYSLLFLVGLTANLLALWVFLFLQRRWDSMHILLVNSAVSDLLLLSILPFRVYYHTNGDEWRLGAAACRLVTHVFYMNMYVNIAMLGLIGLDRYAWLSRRGGGGVRCAPVRSPCGVPWTWVVCGLVWGLALTLMVYSEANRPQKDLEDRKCFQYRRWDSFGCIASVNVALEVMFWLVFIVQVVSYGKIATSRSGRAARKSFFVLLLFTVCFVPYHVFRPIYIRSQFDPSAYDLCRLQQTHQVMVLVSAFNSCLDPVMYFLLSGLMRKAAARAIGTYSISCRIRDRE